MNHARVVIELPDQVAFCVEVGAVHREVAGDVGGEERVGLLHPGDGILQRRIRALGVALQIAGFVDPLAHAIGRGRGSGTQRSYANAFDGDQSSYFLGERAGVVERRDRAQRVADDADRILVDHVGEDREIQDVFWDAVERARSPCAVTVAAQIDGVDVIVLT